MVEIKGGWRKGNKPVLVLSSTLILKTGKEAELTKKTEEIDHTWERDNSKKSGVANQIQCCGETSRLETHYFCNQEKKICKKLRDVGFQP